MDFYYAPPEVLKQMVEDGCAKLRERFNEKERAWQERMEGIRVDNARLRKELLQKEKRIKSLTATLSQYVKERLDLQKVKHKVDFFEGYKLDDLLECLDEQMRFIIQLRFGLTGLKPMTLEAVGHQLGVTRERVRQLQNIAISKMRRASKYLEVTA